MTVTERFSSASARTVASVTVQAPAKLTLSLRVTGTRPDGYHLLDAEFVSIDLADSLTFEPGVGIAIVDRVVGDLGIADLDTTSGNLVHRALDMVGRQSAVRVVKRIPVGAGLGGGSADAAAVLRWARWPSAALAAPLGADVPFCVTGGHARVTGIGEVLEVLPFEDRRFLLLIPPVAVDTGAVYRAYDEQTRETDRTRSVDPSVADHSSDSVNDLEAAALAVTPSLARWRDSLGDITGRRPRLAGSGATWFVDGDPASLGVDDRPYLVLGDERAPLVSVRSIPPEPLA
jgi:4-diphosphocytidyl-2-C-methyl-D-erythritol kinase